MPNDPLLPVIIPEGVTWFLSQLLAAQLVLPSRKSTPLSATGKRLRHGPPHIPCNDCHEIPGGQDVFTKAHGLEDHRSNSWYTPGEIPPQSIFYKGLCSTLGLSTTITSFVRSTFLMTTESSRSRSQLASAFHR